MFVKPLYRGRSSLPGWSRANARADRAKPCSDRSFLAASRIPCVFAFIIVGALSAHGGLLTNTANSRHAQVQAVGLGEVKWTEGFWADRFATCRDRSIPAMWELMRGTEYKPFFQHFLIASGDMKGQHHGAKWNDGDFYKWLEAACSVVAVTQDRGLREIIEQCVDAIGQAQREDGYIHTPVLIKNRNGDSTARPFQDRHNFEMYNMGHLITAACLHHRVTGEEAFLRIARKTADFLDTALAEPTPELARNSVCPSHYMAIVELYRTTSDPRYLKLAERILDMRDLVRNGDADNQDHLPFLRQREAVGHAVRANYLYAGAADLFLETGDSKYWETLNALWTNVTTKKMYITGGCGALYDGAAPYGSSDQGAITRVHQAYGHNYQLPNVTAHNETCAAVGNVLWNWRMYLATGESRFIDVLELALFNSVLSGVSLEGTKYFYVNPLRSEYELPTSLRWSRTRVPFVTSYCCPPNVVRTISQVSGYAYAKERDALRVNLYGSNTLETTMLGQRLRMTQRTNYPWQGNVELSVVEAPDSAFAIKLRVPGWTNELKLSVNGQDMEIPRPLSGYASIRRVWRAGDSLGVRFAMPVQLIESHPLVEETRNHVAVKRGPIVYCLESPDLPKDVRVRDVAIESNVHFTSLDDVPSLGGVSVLAAELVHRPTRDWKSLYRPLASGNRSRVSTRFIPYFVWSNRGESEMSVWLPLAAK